MVGAVVNLVIASATGILRETRGEDTDQKPTYRALQFILGAPIVPAVLFLIVVCFCYESPRFYMRPNTPNFDLNRAFKILLRVRQTRVNTPSHNCESLILGMIH